MIDSWNARTDREIDLTPQVDSTDGQRRIVGRSMTGGGWFTINVSQ